MILELVTINIKPNEQKAFEEALHKAQDIIKQAKGYLSHEFQHCIEEKDKYILLIRWETLEAHMEDFRNSELYKEWRALIGEYFAEPPQVLHFEKF